MLHTGIKGNRELTVTQELTAQAMGSGELPVFATPAVIALAEETAWRSVAPELEPGQGTVGTELHVEHISATPVGMKVTATAKLKKTEGRKMWFDIEVNDEKGKCGEGSHLRIMVNSKGMSEKAAKKAGE